MTELAPRAPSSAARWARDFGLVGLINGLAIPLGDQFRYIRWDQELRLGLAMVASGLVIGALSARLFAGRARRWPKVAFIPLGALAGLASGLGSCAVFWVGVGLTSVEGFHWPDAKEAGIVALYLGATTAAQMVWFWLAYAYQRVNGRSVRGVMGLGCLSAALVGAVSIPAGKYLERHRDHRSGHHQG